MGMSKSRGSCTRPQILPPSPSQGCFAVPESEIEEVISKQVQVSNPIAELDKQDYVKNTVAAGTTMDPNSELSKLISAYAAYGTNITVTFYHGLNSQTYQRTWQTDFSQELDNVHYSYLKINNFQMKLVDSLNFSYETRDTKSQVTGQAILYPYFCPNQGDLFVYQIDETDLGLFRISEAPERLSIKANTCHRIKFILIAYLTKEQLNKLDHCVEDEQYFNLDRYLNDNGALLTSGESNTLNQANGVLSKLINFYNTEFYDDRIYNTYIESACLFDPYLIEFITKILPLDKMPGYPTQLVSDPIYWKRSFWYKLLAPDQVPDEIMITRCFRVYKEVNYRTAGINALANRCFIAIAKCGRHPYPPFRIPTVYDETVKSLPMQVRLYFDTGKVRPEILFDLANKLMTSGRHAQFYYIPILIFLLQKLINALQNGEDVVYNDDINKEPSGDCMDGCMNCIYNCFPPQYPPKQCPGRTHCDCHHEYIGDDGSCCSECDCSGDCTESQLPEE